MYINELQKGFGGKKCGDIIGLHQVRCIFVVHAVPPAVARFPLVCRSPIPPFRDQTKLVCAPSSGFFLPHTNKITHYQPTSLHPTQACRTFSSHTLPRHDFNLTVDTNVSFFSTSWDKHLLRLEEIKHRYVTVAVDQCIWCCIFSSGA